MHSAACFGVAVSFGFSGKPSVILVSIKPGFTVIT